MRKKFAGIIVFAILLIADALLNAQSLFQGPYGAYRDLLQPLPDAAVLTLFLISSIFIIIQMLVGFGLFFKSKEIFRRILLVVCFYRFYTYFIELPFVVFRNFPQYFNQQVLIFSETSAVPFSAALTILKILTFLVMGFEIILFISLAYFLTRPKVKEQFSEEENQTDANIQDEDDVKSLSKFGGWLKFFYLCNWFTIAINIAFFLLLSVIIPLSILFRENLRVNDNLIFSNFIMLAWVIVNTVFLWKIIAIFRKKEKGTLTKISNLMVLWLVVFPIFMYLISKTVAPRSFDIKVFVQNILCLVVFLNYFSNSKRVLAYYGENLTSDIRKKRIFALLGIVSLVLLVWSFTLKISDSYKRMDLRSVEQESDFEKSLDYFEKAISAGMQDKSIFYKAALLQAMKGDLEKASLNFEKFYDIKRKDDSWYYSDKDFVSVLDDVKSGFLDKEAAELLFEGAFYQDLENFDKSVQCYKKSLSIQPGYPLISYKLGWVYHSLGKYAEAEEQFNIVIQEDPNFLGVYHELGTMLDTLGRYPEAIKAYQQYLDLRPNQPRILYNLGSTYRHHGDLKKAILFLKKAIEINPEYSAAFQNMGLSYQSLGEYDEAIKCFEEAIDLWPYFWGSYQGLSFCYLEKGMDRKAIDIMNEAVKADPRSYKPYMGFGVLYKKMGRKDKAIEKYSKALSFSPGNPDILFNLALVQESDPQAKIKTLKKVIEIQPNAKHYAALGRAYVDLEQWDQALIFLKKAYDLDQNYLDISNDIGIVYEEKGMIDDAISEYQKEISKYPDNPKPWYNLGFLYRREKRYEKSIESYQKAVAVDPGYASAFYNIANIYFEDKKDYETAIYYYKEAIAADPSHSSAYYNMGNVYFHKKDYQESIKLYLKAVEIKPEFANGYYGLALAYSEIGKRKLAVQYCDEAVKLGADVRESFLKRVEEYRKNQF